MASFRELDAVPTTQTAIQVRFFIEDSGIDEAGWQIYDPDSGRFITEGEWVRVAPSSRLDLHIELPPQDGAYRVYVSSRRGGMWSYAAGEPFVVVDAVVARAGVRVDSARVTTLAAMRRSSLLSSIPALFTGPVRSVAANWRLIQSMVRRDILARYRGSFGDVFWTVLNPLLLMSTYFFVFGIVLRTRFGPDQSRTSFALYFLAGFLPWLAMSEALGRSPTAILEYRNLVRKLVFPVETIPVNFVLAGLVSELFALAIYLIALLLLHGGIPASALWLPALIIPQVLFTAGVCWFLAGTGAFVRDLGQVIGLVLTLWFFITPICYAEEQLAGLPAAAFWILKKNPVFVLVHGYRAVLLEGHAPDFGPLWKLWVLALVVCVLGYAWFYKLRKSFADVI